MSETRDRRTFVAGIACGLSAAFIWGAFPVMTRLGLTRSELDGADITFIRFAVSGLVLAPYLLLSGVGGVGIVPIALMVVGIGAPYMLVVAAGLAQAPVEHFAVVTPTSMIVFATLAAAVVGGRSPSLRASAGIGLIVAGIAVVGWEQLASARVPVESWALFLAGGLMWAMYTVVSKRYAASPFHATALVSVFSMLLFSPYYLATAGLRLMEVPLDVLIAQAVYQGILVSIVALFFFSKSVQLLGAPSGSTFAALVPASAIMLAALLLGEVPAAAAWLGLSVVTIGMITTLWPGAIRGEDRRHEPSERTTDA